MEVKLENLIEKIRKEGVDEAKAAAETIIAQANDRAKAIEQDAQAKAAGILSQAKQKAESFEINSRQALKQASRDTILAVKSQLFSLMDNLFKRQVGRELSPEFTKELIVKLAQSLAPAKGQVLELEVSQDDKKKLEELVLERFKSAAGAAIEIKATRAIDKGFRIGVKGQDVIYDFSDESIAAALKEFLNPALTAILEKRDE